MECTEYRISCQLKRIADDMASIDWDGFVGTLIATIVGAAIALVGTWWLEKKRAARDVASAAADAEARADERYKERLEELLFEVLRQIGVRLEALERSAREPWNTPNALLASMDTARMAARGIDAQPLKSMRYAMDRVVAVGITADQKLDTRVIGQILRAWREGSTTAEKAVERFDGVRPKT